MSANKKNTNYTFARANGREQTGQKIVVKQLHDLHDKMEVVDPEYVNLRRGKTIVARELK